MGRHVVSLGDFYLRDGRRNIPVQGVLMPHTRLEVVGRYAGVRRLRGLDTSLARLGEAGAGSTITSSAMR